MLDRSSFEAVRIHAYKSAGLGKNSAPKFVRKLVAGTALHRAWLQGRTGSFLVPVLERR